MRHFAHLDAGEVKRLFLRAPADFDRTSDPRTLATALGATLYLPATRPALGKDLLRQAAAGVVSAVVCLEDSVPDRELSAAHANLIDQLAEVAEIAEPGAGDGPGLPLTFVRIRAVEQIASVVDGLGENAGLISGFVLPKFGPANGRVLLEALDDVRARTGLPLLAMPVLESPEVIHAEARMPTLLHLRDLLDEFRERVLAVRLGATDLSSAYGLRRVRDLTIYDVRLVAQVIADVVNVLGRADGTGHVITAPVWEHFSDSGRLFKPQLRVSPFDDHQARRLRHQLIARDLDGLIREVVLDKANGLTGKTVIHPSHVAAVNALSVVTHEEFSDARDIADPDMAGGGVRASAYRNKMNEAGPHRAWALRTLQRAEVFGVAAEDVGLVDLLVAGAAL